MEFIKIYINIYIISFFLGLVGVINLKNNFVILLISIELSILSVSMMFLLKGVYYGHIYSNVLVLCLLVVAACESAIGLGLFVSYFKLNNTLDSNYLYNLKG